jgi:CBS domain containing-hemolysin-like protein
VTIASVAFTLFYFVTVEALSKTLGVLHSDRVALVLAPFVIIVARTLWLPTKALTEIAYLLLPRRPSESVSEEDIRSMTDVSHEEGMIETSERKMIHSIFRFGDTLVGEVLTPRPDIMAISARFSLDEALEAFVQSGFSRLPVHEGRLDDTIGAVHVKDVLRASRLPSPPATVRELIQPIRFVPETRRVAELLEDMQRDRFHLALVVDEHGAVIGLVTLEDLLEEIVGEIEDEHDEEEPPVVEIAPGRWRVAGRLPVSRLNETVGVEFPSRDWTTVAGLLMATLGRPPRPGDAVEIQGYRLSAEHVHGRRILRILVESTRPAERTTAKAQ